MEVVRSGSLIVRKASLELTSGTWAGLVGANGSGKTTLIRALSGRLPLHSGALSLTGRDCTLDRQIIARSVGLSPDIEDLPSNLSGEEYLRLISWQPESRRSLEELESALDFRGFWTRPFGEMSAGMKQRISIFAAFVNGNRLIFLDEPFNWLDPVCTFETKKALHSLVRREGYTLFTPLHDMATLTAYCDYGFLMSGGMIVRELDTSELRNGSKDLVNFESRLIKSLANMPVGI